MLLASWLGVFFLLLPPHRQTNPALTRKPLLHRRYKSVSARKTSFPIFIYRIGGRVGVVVWLGRVLGDGPKRFLWDLGLLFASGRGPLAEWQAARRAARCSRKMAHSISSLSSLFSLSLSQSYLRGLAGACLSLRICVCDGGEFLSGTVKPSFFSSAPSPRRRARSSRAPHGFPRVATIPQESRFAQEYASFPNVAALTKVAERCKIEAYFVSALMLAAVRVQRPTLQFLRAPY